MCGITGIASQKPIGPAEYDLVARVNRQMVHRGPDGSGHHNGEQVALAMRRLSIIALEDGSQPLYNEDRQIALCANGEVYNYIELREQLRAEGHVFATGSDCEVIVHLYEKYGDECVRYLRGMYAFALVDRKRRRVLLARDRMGEKPLYLVESKGRVFFASELRALLATGVVPFELSPAAVSLYFHFSYVPEPHVIVKGVRKLPAAHYLTIELDDWIVREQCYWRMEDAPPLAGDPATVIREHLEQISELIIRSDVPVGVALSGGIDSSVIATLARQKYSRILNAFTVGYEGTTWQDERRQARQLANHLDIPYHEHRLSVSDVVRGYPEMVYSRDDPITDIAGSSFYAVVKLARAHGVPVLLAGYGGDELFWGYPWVAKAVRASERRQHLQQTGRVNPIEYLRPSLPPLSYTGAIGWLRTAGGLASGWELFWQDMQSAPGSLVHFHLCPSVRTAARHVEGILTRALYEQVQHVSFENGVEIMADNSRPDISLTRLICDSYLRENGIAQGDRLSMAQSIELRLPLVDFRLIETVVGLRKSYPDVREQPKKWLIDASRGILPEFVTNRRKRGFTPPWRQWAKGIFRAYGAQLSDGVLVHEQVLNPDAVRRLEKPIHWTGEVVPLSLEALTLELWCREVLKSRHAPGVQAVSVSV